MLATQPFRACLEYMKHPASPRSVFVVVWFPYVVVPVDVDDDYDEDEDVVVAADAAEK